MDKKILSIVLTAAIITSFCGISVSAAEVTSRDATYTVYEPYEYPVVPGTDEWNELGSLEEKIEACAVEEDLMVEMTTSALLETVLSYPLLVNIYAFNTTEAGVQSVSQYFTGIQMLAEREDVGECIMEYVQAVSNADNDATATINQCYIKTLERYIQNAEISPAIGTPFPLPFKRTF